MEFEDDDIEEYDVDSSDEHPRARQLPKSFSNNNNNNQSGKEHQQENELNIEQLKGRKKYVALKLQQLGYSDAQIKILIFKLQANSIEQALEYLIKDASGHNHPFISSSNKNNRRFQAMRNNDICQLCSQERQKHMTSNAEVSMTSLFLEADKMMQLDHMSSMEDSFNLQSKACGICYSNIDWKELALLKCGHFYCEQCLQEFIAYQVQNGNTMQLICPERACQQDISLKYMTNHLMAPSVYEKYVKFNGRREVNRNPDLKWCPTPDCEGYLKKPLLQSIVEVSCPVCNKVTCFGCLQTPHEGTTCDAVLEKEYHEWAQLKTEVGSCKNCRMRIEKAGGCPNMTCQICKHEWCWNCNEDFPVHQPNCPNYYQYLEVLEFQGQINFDDLDMSIWFIRTRRAGFMYWLVSVLFLVGIIMPFMIALNVLLTSCYMYIIITNHFRINRNGIGKCQKVAIFFGGILLYVFVPFTFLFITVPQIGIYAIKKGRELKELCKNRMKFYLQLNPAPIMRRYLRFVRLLKPIRRQQQQQQPETQ